MPSGKQRRYFDKKKQYSQNGHWIAVLLDKMRAHIDSNMTRERFRHPQLELLKHRVLVPAPVWSRIRRTAISMARVLDITIVWDVEVNGNVAVDMQRDKASDKIASS